MQKVDVGKHIVIDPEICHGQMTFRGTTPASGHGASVSR